jgi:hypothetical protein
MGRRYDWFLRHKAMTATAIVALVVVDLAAAGCGSPNKAAPASTRVAAIATSSPIQPTNSPTRASPSAVHVAAKTKPGTALAALPLLAVRGRAPLTDYSRTAFGPAWLDVDRNGCDTRNDILRRDLTSYTLKAGTAGCEVLTGTLHDPYTGKTIHFVRGVGTSETVQIDHVVALGDAWQTGAQGWTLAKREAFANDPLNLLAVDGPTNDSKGDADAASWLPPRASYRCSYVARQEAVKEKYRLWATAAEKSAIARVLATCPTRRLPTAGAIPLGGGRVTSAPTPSSGHTSSGLDPRFSTCAEANAAGYGPYYKGKDPEYYWYEDRDGDGIDCER